MAQIFEKIDQSPNDSRSYRLVNLSNQLTVLLISDPETQKSAACCNVNIGSMSDPDEAPGLAHFLEHMLFMGTEKYPVENAYSAFLNSHGGSSNAYTSQENTVYYFDIQNEFFEEAVDMFASFFVCPLFNESSTSREIIAVDNENTKNLQSDMWRQFQLMKSLARPDHPFSKFSTGNKYTLESMPIERGLKIHEMLVEFYKTHYSANIMKFVLYSAESLDVMQAWAVEKLSPVENRNLTRLVVAPDPYPQELCGKYLEIVPVKDIKSLLLNFPFPEVNSKYLSKPASYISHLFGHEAEGSILSALKTKGFANGLSSYLSEAFTDFASFGVSIELTELGTQHVDEIIECVFAYSGMLNSEGPKEWIYQELVDTKSMNFRFISKTEPSSYVISMSGNMHIYPPDKTITGDRLIFSPDLSAVSELLKLITPEAAIIGFSFREFQSKTEKAEKWYGTEYNERPFSVSQLSSWRTAFTSGSSWNNLLHLPLANSFLPSDFALLYTGPKEEIWDKEGRQLPALIERVVIRQNDDAIPKVHLIDAVAPSAAKVDADEGGEEDDEGGENFEAADNTISESTGRKLMTWFMEDRKWAIPKVNVILKIESVHAYSTPLNVALTELFTKVLDESLVKISYFADCAGLHFSVSNTFSGVDFAFYGYNHKLPILVFQVIEAMKKLVTEPEEGIEDVYHRMKEKVLLDYKNFAFSQPYMHCVYGTLNCIESPRWSVIEKRHALKNSTFSEFKGFCSILLKSVHTEMFVHGNATVGLTRDLSRRVQDVLQSSPLSFSESVSRRLINFKVGTSYLYRQHAVHNNAKEVNSAVENVYFACLQDQPFSSAPLELGIEKWGRLGTTALLLLLGHMISEPAFDSLRTKEQLGYIVSASVVKFMSKYWALRIIVQSNSRHAQYLDDRIENFLIEYRQTLCQMTQEEFQSNVKAVIESLLEKPKNLKGETNSFFDEINSGAYMFNRKIAQADFLKTSRLQDIIDVFDRFVSPGSTMRTKMSSQFYGAKWAYEPVPSRVTHITDFAAFKQSMGLMGFESCSEAIKLSPDGVAR